MGVPMDLKSVRRRCDDALARVPVPTPFTVEAFAELISNYRGRPLRLIPKQTSFGPCGVWLALPDADYVFYEPQTSALHRDHIILHELGHLLCQHTASELVDDQVVRELFPSLDVRIVQRVLGRTTYTAVEEQEAEMIASMVRERVSGISAARDGRYDDIVLDRFQAALGGSSPTRDG